MPAHLRNRPPVAGSSEELFSFPYPLKICPTEKQDIGITKRNHLTVQSYVSNSMASQAISD